MEVDGCSDIRNTALWDSLRSCLRHLVLRRLGVVDAWSCDRNGLAPRPSPLGIPLVGSPPLPIFLFLFTPVAGCPFLIPLHPLSAHRRRRSF